MLRIPLLDSISGCNPPNNMGAGMKTVLFDLDGTLLDTIAGLQIALNEVLGLRGLPLHTPQAMRQMVGEGIEVLIDRALPESQRNDATINQIVLEMKVAYDRVWEQGTQPYPGIPQMLAQIQHAGVPCSVLSNKPDEFTRVMVQHYFNDIPFVHVRGSLPGVPKKPEPDVALQIAAMMGGTPEQSIFVGDTWVDIQTGVRAGMKTAGVLWGFRDEAELKKAGATVIVSNPQELARYILG